MSEWIPVSERLPDGKDITDVMVTIQRSDGALRVRSGIFYKDIFSIDNGDVWRVGEKGLLAWMPLPTPYKED